MLNLLFPYLFAPVGFHPRHSRAITNGLIFKCNRGDIGACFVVLRARYTKGGYLLGQMSYVRINYASDYPTVTTTRRPLDDGARYFGPYYNTQAIRQALKLLRRVFPYATSKVAGQKRANLHYHLGLDPGLEEGRTSLDNYRSNLRKLIAVIEGKRQAIEKEIEKDMKQAAKNADFEKAAKLRNQLFALRSLTRQVLFSDKEFLDISKDHALNELVNMLSINGFPSRIEGYDISHVLQAR